ncbi:hypothetical protein BW721_04885 [Jeotgalibaca sp. PTS2502]|uniref:helix-turn-helix transcriptional regulator n=1 Tax=Jeotgalibaca sp. PTS2502 TaxID=1903686 RepID=UPI0009738B7C|nr:helix-turn-helix domain-containing protein [Jeotgalibaca sp. PTS2502]APZ49072.1 hypothetical protein BW721_04885 [Jeotgalibaca sp. PTS2502]
MANRIAGYRRMLGMNQKDLAKDFGISVQAYSAKERGVTSFKDSEKARFKELLKTLFPDITIDEIFFD